MTLYLVWGGHDDGDDFTGYVYADKSLAERHAAAIYAGSVREANLENALPEWVKNMEAPR